MTTYQYICAYCQKRYGETAAEGSHGCCPECFTGLWRYVCTFKVNPDSEPGVGGQLVLDEAGVRWRLQDDYSDLDAAVEALKRGETLETPFASFEARLAEYCDI